MRLTLIIDGQPHEIDTTDPELLAKWIVEIFGRLPTIYPSTQIEIRAMPSWVYVEKSQQWGPDWAADSRVLGQLRPIRSPRDLVAALTAQLDELDALKATDGHA